MDEWTKHENGTEHASTQPQGEFESTQSGVPPYGAYPPYPPYPPGRKKRKWAAGLLSFLFPGLGHFYAGAMQRGLFFMLLFVGAIVGVVFFAESGIVPLIVLISIMIPVVFFYSLFDALQTTDRINRYGEDYSFPHPPGAFGNPYDVPAGSAYRRSISGSQAGIALIAVGALLFLATNKPAWVETLIQGSGSFVGALILIGAGVYLFISESRKNK